MELDLNSHEFVAMHTRNGQELPFEGMTLVLGKSAATCPLEPGDTYIAARNTGVKLLTCQYMSDDNSYVVPVEAAYCFDSYECRKVEEIKDS